MFKSLLLLFSFIILLVCAYAAIAKVTKEPQGPTTFSEDYTNSQYWLEPDNVNVASLNQKITYEGEIMFMNTEFNNDGSFKKWEITYSYKDPNNVILYNTLSLPNKSLNEGIIYMQNIGNEATYKEEVLSFSEFSQRVQDKKNKYKFQVDVIYGLSDDSISYINLFTIQDAEN